MEMKKYNCKKCKDTKLIRCPICLGTGATLDSSGYRVCFNCNGELIVQCIHCCDMKN